MQCISVRKLGRRTKPKLERSNGGVHFPYFRAAGVREPVDPIIREKIVELSHQSVRKVREMRRHLEAMVNSDLLVRGQVLDKMLRRFFPTNKDIYNHMYRARVTHRFSALDLKNLDALIVQWKKIPQVMPSFADLILATLMTIKKMTMIAG